MKIRLFTHTDFDGVGCAIALKSLWGEENVDVTYCDYDKINDKVTNFIEGKTEYPLNDYTHIFITDISVNEEVAEKLQALNEDMETTPFVQLLDHHGTAEWLNKYDWAFVEPNLRGRPNHKSSGTSLILDFFEHQRPGFKVKPSSSLRRFLEQVRRYDTWEWHNIYDDEGPKDMNNILYIVGREEFVRNRLASIQNGDGLELTEKEASLLEQRQKEIKEYIDKKETQLIKVLAGADENDNYQYAGIVFAEQHISELGNELCKRHADIDYVGIVDMGAMKVSFRTVKEVDVSEIAKRLGGGGHPKAAGAPIKQESIIEFLSSI